MYVSEQACLKADPQICVYIFVRKFSRETGKVVGGGGEQGGRKPSVCAITRVRRGSFLPDLLADYINSINQVSGLS